MAKEEPKRDVIEILYADADLVSSFSSQMSGGLENAAQMTQALQQDAGTEVEKGGPVEVSASTGLWGGSVTVPAKRLLETDGQSTREEITREMVPHDYAVLQLIDQLLPEISSEMVVASGSTLVKWEGKLFYVDQPTLLRLLDRLGALMPGASLFRAISAEEATELGDPSLAGSNLATYYADVLTVLPSVPFFVFTLLDNGQRYMVPVKSEYMRYSQDMMEALYPSGKLGRWKVFGLLHDASSGMPPSEAGTDLHLLQVVEEIHRAKQGFYVEFGLPETTMVPVVIYQDVSKRGKQEDDR